MALRAITWLVPGLPEGFFALAARALGADLVVAHAASGPTPDDDPFARDEADIGFLCAPSYRALDTVSLVPAAPVFDDDRTGGRPVYFSELVVRDTSTARFLAHLAGGVWAYNDPQSLSGCHSLDRTLAARGLPPTFFSSRRATGSHAASLRAVAGGEADAAAIDSNVLRRLPRDGVRVIETWGPWPVQPVVAASRLGVDFVRDAADALLALDPRDLATFGVRCFAPTSEADYRTS